MAYVSLEQMFKNAWVWLFFQSKHVGIKLIDIYFVDVARRR
jgi:hypothetical protein